MSYIIYTTCFGDKFKLIKNHWIKRIDDICKKKEDLIVEEFNANPYFNNFGYTYGWLDNIRLDKIIELCKNKNKPVVQIDLDIIIEKEIDDLVNLPYDFIISTEIGGNQSFPKECSQKLGFGLCCGFYIVKPESLSFMTTILKNMRNGTYNCINDQETLMNYIVNNNYKVYDSECVLNGITFKNKIIEIDDIKICVLDFDIIIRDPITIKNQYGNHINIDNVGGSDNFIKYFYEPLEKLPLTCRCGKTHLGDYNVCKHIR